MSARIGRRKFLATLGGLGVGAWPHAARAQQDGRMRRVGVVVGLGENDPELQSWLAAFRQGLEKLGWAEGRNLRIEYRLGSRHIPEEYQALAHEALAQQPDVILGHGTPTAVALQQQTRTVPIVFVAVSDPVGSGIIASLARPGGNLTGLLQYEEGIVGKWLGMLKEIAPRLSRVAHGECENDPV
jgi:putative ABC transport system substrate-binding protein